MPDEIRLENYPMRSSDKIRYGDTDRQGHVNNAVFSTMLETGRVEMILDSAAPLGEVGCSFVIARLLINFRAEMKWPGTISIGTRVVSIGRSSIQLEQVLFQGSLCVADAETVIVQTDVITRRSKPLSDTAISRLSSLVSKRKT